MNMLSWFRKIWAVIFPKAKATRKPNKPRQTFETGAHYYLGDLLESLDDYNKVVKKLKRHYPDAYDYYVRVGCPVTSDDIRVDKTLGAHWRNGSERPAIMMCHFAQRSWQDDMDDDKVYPTFLLLQKMKAVSGVQFTNSDLYEGTLFYRERKSTKIIVGLPYYTSVDPEGNISLLRQLKTYPMRQYSKKMRTRKAEIRGRRSNMTSGVVQRWGLPDYVIEMAHDKKETPQEWALINFTIVACFAETLNSGLLIRAKKNNACAAFSIDLLRTPYFFKNRIKVKTESGKTKPIFHIVRTHQRKTGSFVKTHFRGLRRFNWHDHDVTISMPGFHHQNVFEFSGEAISVDDPEMAELETMSMKNVGRKFDQHMDQ